MERTVHLKRATIRNYVGLFLFSLLLAGGNVVLGRSEFGGYDLSAMIDCAWRVLSGQTPGVDFPCPFPPTFYIFTVWAFRAFGLKWISLLFAEDILFLILTAAGLHLCWLLQRRRADGNILAVAWVYVAAQAMLLIAFNHPWHSTTASGFSAYAVLATFVLLQNLGRSENWQSAMHLAFAFSVLVLSKPNTAWPALLLCMFCLLREPYSRGLGSLSLVLGLAIDSALLLSWHTDLRHMFIGYLGVSGRAVPRLFIVGITPDASRVIGNTVKCTYLALLLPMYHLLSALWRDRTRIWHSTHHLLCVGAVLVSVIGLGTNWDLKISDVACLLVGIAILATTSLENTRTLVPSLRFAIPVLLALAFLFGVERIRMQGVGAWAGDTYGAKTVIHDPFFGTFKTRAAFEHVLVEADSVISQSANRKIFFGPRLEFLYAREGLISPKQLPIWWHPGSSYALREEPQIVENWKQAHFEVVMFARNDRTRIPPNLIRYIQTHYKYDPRHTQIDVYYAQQ